MKIELRSDSVHISGYVNAVGRDSRPITGATEKFVEMIEPEAFRASLERNPHVELLLNHNKERRLASTDEGTLRLEEDNIGLRAECDITDAEVIEKARKRELIGWSFGMYAIDTEKEERADNIPRRHVKKLDMFEVSLIDNTMRPAYAGTLVECRAEGAVVSETRSNDDEAELLDYSKWEKKAAELAIAPYERRLEELRYNPYHDPANGRFTTANGGGSGGGFLYSKSGKSFYVLDSKEFTQKINPHQQKAIDRMNEVLSKDKTVSKMPEYTILNSGNIGFEYEKTEIYAREKGGKMIDPLKADTIERISKVSGTILIDDSGNRRISGKKHNTISEKVIKKGSSSKKSSAQSSLKVSTYVINAGTSSQHFGLKDREGNVLHAPNKWKTEKGALNWAKKNGWT